MTKLLTTILLSILTITVNAQVTDAENHFKELKPIRFPDGREGWRELMPTRLR